MHEVSGRSWLQVLRVLALAAMLGLIAWVRVWLHVEASARSDPAIVWYGAVATAAYLVPGLVLLVRRRWHVVGWLLCVLAVVMAFTFSSDWGGIRFGDRWMVWLLDLVEGTVFWLPFTALLVVFPDGLGARTARQRTTGLMLIAVASAVVIPELLVTEVVGQGGRLVPSPVGVAFLPVAVENVTSAVAFVALAAAFVGMVRRYRASTAGTRRQYRWVFAAIAVLTRVLPRSSDLAVAASTLAAAAVVRPLHRRVHAAVDRRFNRPRFDAEHEIGRFVRGLRDQTDLAVVEASLSDVVSRTVHPASYFLWIRST